MTKKAWLKVIPWDKDKATLGIESGADALIVPEGYSCEVKKLGIIDTVSADGDIKLGKDVEELEICGKEDEREALRLSATMMLILRMKDWTIIPLENLIAETGGLMVEVRTASEAKTAAQILEKGADGIVIDSDDAGEIKKAIQAVKESSEPLTLSKIALNEIRPVGMGDRVCVDTCTSLEKGQGLLAGNGAEAMFLVHSETIENPYVTPRPFRVNAGAVHAYTLVPGGKTRYLAELRSGEEALIVDSGGDSRAAVIGRIKIERRPLVYVEGETEAGAKASLVLQNAETVRLVCEEGKSKSIVELKEKDEVLGYVSDAARHFGIKIEETIQEK